MQLLDDRREGSPDNGAPENVFDAGEGDVCQFDEARSRGSDMKLLPDVSAGITLGPKVTKDKLMQGAGRMR